MADVTPQPDSELETPAQRRGLEGLRSPLVWVVIVVAVLLLIGNTMLRTEFRAAAVEQASSDMEQLLRSYEGNIEQRFLNIETTLQSLALLIGTNEYSPRETHLLLRQAVQTLGIVRVIGVTDHTGMVVRSSRSDPAPAVSLAGRDYIDYYLAGGQAPRFLSAPVVNLVDKQWQVSLAVPVRTRSGELWGVISAVVDPRLIIEALVPVAESGDFVTLFYEDFRLIARLPWLEDRIGTSLADAEIFRDLVRSPHGRVVGTYTGRISGDHRLGAATRLFHDKLVLSTSRPLEGALGFWPVLELVAAIGSLAILAFVVLIAWLIRRRLLEAANHAATLERLNLRLQEESRRSAQLARVKSRFLANMSHEIRTPMNAILGLGHLLEETRLEGTQRTYVEQMLGSGRFLLGLLDDILSFTRAESGRLVLERAEFDLEALLEALAGIIGTNLGSRRVEIVFDLPPEVPRWLLGDAMRLEQVLVNLLGNAIKFTEAGEVLLRIELVRLDADTVELRFLVSDTGIGISAQDLPQLFDAFMQGDAPLARRSGGVGLGLAICQRIVGLMGGRIEVRSEPGQGSEFSFAVPFGRSHRIPETPAVPENRSAIVAEDHPLAREVLARMLGGLGWRVVELDSAQAVRERLERARAGGERFDLLALDAGMAMQAQQSLLHDLLHDAVRDHGGERPRILLLANAIEQRELIAALDGFGLRNALLAKPVTCPALAAALARLRLGTVNRGTDGPAGVHRQRIDGVRVLLVEDNEVNQVVAGRVLERAGARVSIAGDGRAAIDRVAADPDGFDVILMDIQLPQMDGYEVTRRIRQLPGWQERPIIALTAGVLDQNRERCLAAGMNEFIAKPIEPDRMIRTLIGAVGRSGPEAQEPAVRTVSRGTLPTVDGVDAGRALTLFADQRALFESLLVQFSDRYRTIMDEVRAGLADEQAEQAEQVGRRLHELRGAAGNLGALRVSEAAAALESAIGKGVHERVGPAAEHLDTCLTELLDGIRALRHEGVEELAVCNEVPAEAFTELMDLLAAHNMKAVVRVEELAPALRGQFGAERVAGLGRAIEALDFARAAELLSRMREEREEIE